MLDVVYNVKGSITLIVTILILLLLLVLVKVFNINIFKSIGSILTLIIRVVGKGINIREKKYHRDLEIGKITEKRVRYKTYRFLNDLVIDLGLKRKGVTPYELLLIVIILSGLITLVVSQLIFDSIILTAILYPMVFAGVVCGLYTKANIAHDARIEAIMEAENIISNNIKDGVVVAIRNNIDAMPEMLRTDFRDFLDNIEQKNYHIRTALLELNNNLGSIADDFIKKCIIFEMEEEHGLVGIFKDVVEINNVKSELRMVMKRKFEEAVTEFVIGALMIFIFLGGVIAAFPIIADFYFKTVLGNLLLVMDALILIGEFVYMTYLRAKEL